MPHFLTTGKAAQLCSVKPDTVLKWIKKGRIAATRTAGGHYRIEENTLVPLMPGLPSKDPPATAATGPAAHCLRCWEYMGSALREECKQCVVYKMRCGCCFDLVKLVKGAEHAKCFSAGLCQECPYYRRAHNLPPNVLVVTRDEPLIQNIAKKANGSAAVRYARNGYETSAIISVFRPAVVVVGEAVAASEPDLIEALAADPRVPGVRILFGLRKGSSTVQPMRGAIAGVMERPFCCDEIVAWTGQFQVEAVTEEEPAPEVKPAPVRNGGRLAKSREPIPA
jgi:excisionase family DNA binding protein